MRPEEGVKLTELQLLMIVKLPNVDAELLDREAPTPVQTSATAQS